MLAELNMELDVKRQEFGYYQSSSLQGVLMEQINCDYAAELHRQGLNPYSQNITVSGEKVIWSVKTLNKEAFEQIMIPLQNAAFDGFQLDRKAAYTGIRKKELITTEKQILLEEFYQKKGDRYLSIEFLTPTAFKSNGRYVIWPELRQIYQSLMNKYSAASMDGMEMFDEDILEQLVLNSEITWYRIRSTGFPMEGVRIPSFMGTIRIRLHGTDTLARYARFLMRFGVYSGTGIKTAMGMGAIRLNERRLKND